MLSTSPFHVLLHVAPYLCVKDGQGGGLILSPRLQEYTASKFHTPLGEETEKGDKGSWLLATGLPLFCEILPEGARSTS